jgi:hypothetical protein
MQIERRRNRSTRPFEALEMYLDAARARLGVTALALGSPEGWLIAGAGEDLDRLAHEGAHVASGAAGAPDLATWRMCLGDGDVVLTSAGRAMSADLADGVRRILTG